MLLPKTKIYSILLIFSSLKLMRNQKSNIFTETCFLFKMLLLIERKLKLPFAFYKELASTE